MGTEKYDAIVAYNETLPRYVSYMPAKKRIYWIHCDYRRHAMGKDESKYYDKMDTVKQFSLIPSIASKIKQLTDRPFRWYIIGDGEDQQTIESATKTAHLEDVVIMLGKKSNVYAYMAKADAYVCTSSEAHPLVINEARALQKPVICNKFPSAFESVVDGRDGYIVPINQMPVI